MSINNAKQKEVVVKASFVKAGAFKQHFRNSTCVLPISVGQNYHEGDKLKATISLINKNEFKFCTIALCDT